MEYQVYRLRNKETKKLVAGVQYNNFYSFNTGDKIAYSTTGKEWKNLKSLIKFIDREFKSIKDFKDNFEVIEVLVSETEIRQIPLTEDTQEIKEINSIVFREEQFKNLEDLRKLLKNKSEIDKFRYGIEVKNYKAINPYYSNYKDMIKIKHTMKKHGIESKYRGSAIAFDELTAISLFGITFGDEFSITVAMDFIDDVKLNIKEFKEKYNL